MTLWKYSQYVFFLFIILFQFIFKYLITLFFKVLGIEAARKVFLQELTSVLSFDGGYVNCRHLMLLADFCTHYGYLVPLTRHGLNSIQSYGPLKRCSFELTVDHLMNAGMFSESDMLQVII